MLSIPLKRTLSRQNTAPNAQRISTTKNLIITNSQANFSLFENRPSPLVSQTSSYSPSNGPPSSKSSGITTNLLQFCSQLENQLKEQTHQNNPSLSEKSAQMLAQSDHPLHRPSASSSEIRVVSTFRTPSEHEKYQQNFYLELMMPFSTWNSEESKKYLSKRKMKRQAFKQRLDLAMQDEFEYDPQAASMVDPLKFSDEEDEDNFFCDEQETELAATQATTPTLSLRRRASLLVLVFGFQFFIGYLLAVDYKRQKKQKKC